MMLDKINVNLEGNNIVIHIKINRNAKRLSLRLRPMDGSIALTAPIHAKPHDITAFVEKSKPWLKKVTHKQAQDVTFHQDNIIPILGQKHHIQYAYAERPQVQVNDGCILVHGFDPIIVPGQVKEWLCDHIYSYLSQTSRMLASRINQNINSITLKETSSRWGSCSQQKNLNFSWRLVFAPEEVAHYVCAHEVSHLIEMNHSPAFWKIVESLSPNYRQHVKWLKENGQSLFKYG